MFYIYNHSKTDLTMIVAELGPFQYGVVVLVSSFDLIWAFIGGVRWGNEVLGSLPMNCSQVF